VGPLAGVRVIELAGIGPGPFACMLLADLGAEVVTVHRPATGPTQATGHEALFRGRTALTVDLRDPRGAGLVRDLCASADVLVEGFRPGVAERLGVGPDDCRARNLRLVYGRITAWGQDGPLAGVAAHDLDVIARTGVLDTIGTADGPVVPLNLVADFGGGGMLLVVGVLSALLQARATGEGDVVDAAMVDGASLLMTMFHGMRDVGLLDGARGTHLLDGGAPFYRTYRTADGRWVSVAAIEPQFYAALCDLLDLDDEVRHGQHDRSRWPELGRRVEVAVASLTRDEVMARVEALGRDACVSPVLSLHEVTQHPHHRARASFTATESGVVPAPAPRFARNVLGSGTAPAPPADVTALLVHLGVDEEAARRAVDAGVVAAGGPG
jgi:alpha-methylacyl-CoA racemase